MVASLGCLQDVEQAADIVKLAGGGALQFVDVGSKSFNPRDEQELREKLGDYLGSGGREIIPPTDPGLTLYAQALTQSLELRSRFLEYAILRGASCLNTSG